MTLEEAREFFKGDKFACECLGAVIEEVGDGYSRISMKVEDSHRAAHGGVMGGALFTLADFAFAVACNTPDSLTVTATSNINFLSGAKTDKLTAECRRIRNGRRVLFLRNNGKGFRRKYCRNGFGGRSAYEVRNSGQILTDLPFCHTANIIIAVL